MWKWEEFIVGKKDRFREKRKEKKISEKRTFNENFQSSEKSKKYQHSKQKPSFNFIKSTLKMVCYFFIFLFILPSPFLSFYAFFYQFLESSLIINHSSCFLIIFGVISKSLSYFGLSMQLNRFPLTFFWLLDPCDVCNLFEL